MLRADDIRTDFPIFQNHPELVYLDNAATTQKPQAVITALQQFYTHHYANIHRGLYDIAVQASQRYETVRAKVAQYIGATYTEEIVYTSGATASINLVAQSFLMPRLQVGDEVWISQMEHHANLIPWQMACKATGAHLRVLPIDEAGQLDMEVIKMLRPEKAKFLALTHVSNALGTVNPIRQILRITKEKGIPVLIDAAQSVAHYPIDVSDLGVNFLVFSGHKLFGPTGIGILYGDQYSLSQMQPVSYGGDMIRDVSMKRTEFLPPPQCFEAGTTNIAGVIGLGAAIDYIDALPKQDILDHLADLRTYALSKLANVDGFRLIGPRDSNSAILSFEIKGIHPHDVATILSTQQIAIRAGNHCAQPLMDYLDLPGTNRISFTIYNNYGDIDRLIHALQQIGVLFNGL